MNLIDWLGFIGVFQILLAYFLTTINKISNSDLSYISLNICGAGMACLASAFLKYIPFIILEGAWTLISLKSLYDYYR